MTILFQKHPTAPFFPNQNIQDYGKKRAKKICCSREKEGKKCALLTDFTGNLPLP